MSGRSFVTLGELLTEFSPLQWRHNGRDSVSNHQPQHCLLYGLFRRRWKKTSKLRVTGLYAGNSSVTGEFPAQMVSNAENVSIWWRHHGGVSFSRIQTTYLNCSVVVLEIRRRIRVQDAETSSYLTLKNTGKWITLIHPQWHVTTKKHTKRVCILCGIYRIWYLAQQSPQSSTKLPDHQSNAMEKCSLQWCHMNAMASQITGNSTTCSTANAKETIKASHYWSIVRGIHR